MTFDAAFAAGMVIASVGWLLFLVFIAKIADLLYTVEVEYRWVGYVMIGGIVLNIGLTLGYVATLAVGAFQATNGGIVADVFLPFSFQIVLPESGRGINAG